MAALEIPEEYQEGLAKLSSLSDQSFQELLSALEESPIALKYTTVARNVASKVTAIPKEDVEEIIGLGIALNIVRSNATVKTPEFLEDVCEALDESGKVEFTSDGRDDFKQRLLQLL